MQWTHSLPPSLLGRLSKHTRTHTHAHTHTSTHTHMHTHTSTHTCMHTHTHAGCLLPTSTSTCRDTGVQCGRDRASPRQKKRRGKRREINEVSNYLFYCFTVWAQCNIELSSTVSDHEPTHFSYCVAGILGR